MTPIPQQAELGRRMDGWCIEVVSIGKCNGNPDLSALGKLEGSGQEIKYQFNQLSRRDRPDLALEMIVVGQAEIIIRGLAQGSM